MNGMQPTALLFFKTGKTGKSGINERIKEIETSLQTEYLQGQTKET